MEATAQRPRIDLSAFSDPLTVQDASTLLKQSDQTIRKLARTGELPSVRIGARIYFTKAAIADKFGCVQDAS